MFLWTVLSFLLFPTCFCDPREANNAFSSWTPKYSEFSSVFWTYCNTTPCILLKMIRAKENWIFHCENTWLRYYEAKLVNNSCKDHFNKQRRGAWGLDGLNICARNQFGNFQNKMAAPTRRKGKGFILSRKLMRFRAFFWLYVSTII